MCAAHDVVALLVRAGTRRPRNRPRRTWRPARMACGPGYRAGVRGPPRIVTSVIEARFDDLTGQDPSFRLVGPAGVLEARRPDEVTGVLAAAEQAAARGLWVAGYVAYEAAPGLDPALRVRAPAPTTRSPTVPLAWFAMFEGREETALPDPPADQPACRPPPGCPSMTRSDYDAAIGADPSAHRGRRHLPGQLHAARCAPASTATARGLYRDLCFAQRGAYAAYLDTGRYPRPVGLARAVLPDRRATTSPRNR